MFSRSASNTKHVGQLATAQDTNGDPFSGEVPLLLHFDVNKTILQTDSIQLKDTEDGIREGIAELFWGQTRTEGDKLLWEWTRSKPSCLPPTDDIRTAGDSLVNYAQFCKMVYPKDRAARKDAVKTFGLVGDGLTKKEMHKQLQLAMKKMQLPAEHRGSREVQDAGVKGSTYNAFPALFHLVANLQRSKRTFAILFRSFGVDHEKVQQEWNAFCELRHPIFSPLIEDIGPLDGSVPGVPDRRIHAIHTIYRDARGPVLILDTLTNGPKESTWDDWAKAKPAPKTDTRDGRRFIQKVLKAKAVEGVSGFQKFMEKHLLRQRTAAIKDDWAWWTFNEEKASAGKLLTLIGGRRPTQQLFLDDNIEHNDARIVDCRDSVGQAMSHAKTLNKLCVKVNPVEAILDDDYFLWKLLRSQGDRQDVGHSIMGLQKKKLTEVESQNAVLQDQLHVSHNQLRILVDEMRRMRLQRRIVVRDEASLQSLLSKHVDVTSFDQGGYRSVADLFAELEQGHCWLEIDEQGQLVRVMDMVFFKLCFKDLILVETHEEDSSGRISTRNFLPGMTTSVLETSMQVQIERWLQKGLGVDLQKCTEGDFLPIFDRDAPSQQTVSTKAYPLRCVVHQSHATLVIPEKEVEISKKLLGKIGLPNAQRFTTLETDVHGATITRFMRWDRRAIWESSSGASGGDKRAARLDVAEVCDKLFRGNPRADDYKRLLLEMFEQFDSFEAQMLTGGFGGSAVIRVQPYEQDGRPSEPCVVKLDAGGLIRDEFQKSVNVFAALPDRAARILGDPVYSADQEFGAMRLELAGACWNNPELAQGSSASNLLSTFKDLLLYESEQALLTRASESLGGGGDENRPFGNVNSVLAETFGPSGVVSSLRRGGAGLRRSEDRPLLDGWYTLKGKPTQFNAYTAAKGEYPPEGAMRRLYKEHFRAEMPSLKDLAVDSIKERLQSLAGSAGRELRPLIGLAHGDLNAANIMIDASDALWMIDFATSVDLPLFTDMCKFEMACLFEYATIPITPKLLVEFAGTQESLWRSMNVGDWLRTDQEVVVRLLQKLVALPPERLSGMSPADLEQLIDEVVRRSGKKPEKQRKMERALKARLVVDEAAVTAAFSYCSSISNALLRGDNLGETLNVSGIPLPDVRGGKVNGASSLKLFMDHCVTVRRFMAQDIAGCLKDEVKVQNDLQPVDWMSLQLYLPFLREAYRIVGYRDIAPQYKVWAIYHCHKVSQNIQRVLTAMGKNAKKLGELGFLSSLNKDLESKRPSTRLTSTSCTSSDCDLQTASFWVHARPHIFPSDPSKKSVREDHRDCDEFRDRPGLYSKVNGVVAMSSVSFKFDLPPTTPSANGAAWDVMLEGPRGTVSIGVAVTSGRRETEKIVVYLRSRLLPWDLQMLHRKEQEGLSDSAADTHRPGDVVSEQQSGASEHSSSTCSESAAFLRLEATAYDKHQKKKVFMLELGAPVYCYPPGTAICVDTAAEGGDSYKASSLIVGQLGEHGDYSVRGAEEGRAESDFDPAAGNHVFLASSRYRRGDQVLVRGRGAAGWRAATVVEEPSRETGFHFRLETGFRDFRMEQPGHQSREAQLRYLCPLNSGQLLPGVSVESFEEESQRFKHTLRAKLGFTIDPLSGDRLNVRECAPLGLTLLGPGFGLDAAPVAPASSSAAVVGNLSSASTAASTTAAPAGASQKHGLASIMSVVERFETGSPSCSANAFLILGQPGSGKTCLVHRLIMETMDRHPHIMPLLLPVADLVKRSSSVDLDPDTWFDKYLRITFGEDSNRYLMICQAMRMNHAMFVFEGLEECGELKPVVERCIQRQVLQRRLVVVTSRPLIGGQSSLQDISESIVALKVESLTEEHIRMVAHTRLGHERIESFDQIFAKVRGSRDAPDADDAAGQAADGEGRPEVFGNPMMLSMLLCYLQTMQRKEAERREAQRRGQAYEEQGEDREGATTTAVYRVAIDVMLSRMQRRQMADRLNKHEELERWKQILEVMALHMVLHERDSIGAWEVEKLLTGQLRRAWPGMKKAVVSGHAMFLRVTDPTKEEMQFLAKDFMNFFAASATARSGGSELPGLGALFSDPGWSQMLEMLAEAWPQQYVRIVEQRLSRFHGTHGDSYLHVAARAGHRPIFQNLRLFTERNREVLKTRNDDQQTPLHIAAEKGNTQLCALMLDHGAPMDAWDSQERLAMHAAMQHGHFQTAKFLMQQWSKHGHTAGQRHKRGRGPVEHLASRVMGEFSDRSAPLAAEKEFLQAAESLFMELRFFNDKEADARKSTLSALLAVFWVAGNHHDLFVRDQKGDALPPGHVPLTAGSWDKLQEWARRTVGLTQSQSMLSAIMVFVAVMNLGKIRAFRMAFAPEFDEPDEALANILQKSPILIPSFAKLDDHQQHAILSALKANFNFGQFLQAENLPANLSSAKQILMESGGGSGSVNTLGLFLFRNFASMCGIRGKESLEGSRFMTETFYANYKVGLDVLQHLMRESASQVYDRFLAERAKGQGLSFSARDPESRARVRLACLTRVFDQDGGQKVSAAFAALQPEKRAALTNFLNADGIEQKPGFLLYFAPQLLENARRNPSVGLAAGMEMLLSVYQAAAKEYCSSEKPVVTVMLNEIRDRAKECQDLDAFRFTKFEIARTSGLKSDSQGTLRTSPWQLQADQRLLNQLASNAAGLVSETLSSKPLREPVFLRKLPRAFPELAFYDGDSAEDGRAALRQTQLALLTVYWVASDQPEAFTRGQDADAKLSAKSWGRIRELAKQSGMLHNEEVLNALLVAVALQGLGRLPKFRAQLAPGAGDHRQAIARVLEDSPKVLPSFWRLGVQYQQLVKGCLGRRLFDFRQFLNAESIPASITTIKGMLQRDCGGELGSSQFLHLFVFLIFSQMAASTGLQSLEGSLCMTESLWLEFESGLEALKNLESQSEAAIYSRYLQLHSKACGLRSDDGSQEARAAARVACLARVADAKGAARVREAFSALGASERTALARHLTADGVVAKPGFVLGGGSAFLANALANDQVGLVPALRILLQVYKAAERHFAKSSSHVLTIDLDRLASFTQGFAGSVTFQEISFELVTKSAIEATVIPKVWIPVRNKEVLVSLRVEARQLAADMLGNKISESQFRARLERVFPELSYFGSASEQLSKTVCSLLSVYWAVTSQHAAFVRGQPDEELLSKHSWSWVQGWLKTGVKLTSEEAVDAMLTAVAISALGSIPEFREEFAPRVNASLHDAVLHHILEAQPEVVPSFQRLPDKYKRLLLDCFRVNFRFSEFLLAENVPANLAQVKSAMQPHGEDGLAFFCFRIFARACGKLGARHLWGSLFMTETQLHRFKPALDGLQQLGALDAGAAYNAYLLHLQGSRALVCFTSPEHQALTRLLCLESTSEDSGAAAVSEAFKALEPREREGLTRLLTADGLGSKPGFVLCGAPDLLRAARANPNVGLTAALRMLLQIQERCSSSFSTRKMRVDLEELAGCAQQATHLGEFANAPLQVGYDDQGDTRVCTVSVGGPGRTGSKMRTLGAQRAAASSSWSIWSMFSCTSAASAGVQVEEVVM